MTILGYIVFGPEGPLMLGHYEDTPRAGILVSGDAAATVFRTRRAAQRAMQRTAAYAEARGFTWRTSRWRIARLTR